MFKIARVILTKKLKKGDIYLPPPPPPPPVWATCSNSAINFYGRYFSALVEFKQVG